MLLSTALHALTQTSLQSHPPAPWLTDSSCPHAPPPPISPLHYEPARHAEDDVFAYSVPQYANQFAYTEPRQAGSEARRDSSNSDRNFNGEESNSGHSLRQQAESLCSWQSINGQCALPPLSLVAVAARESPQTPSHARTQSILTHFTPSGSISSLRSASDAGIVNSALGFTDVDAGQKAALTPPFCRSQSISTSIERLTASGQRSSPKRSARDLSDDTFAQRTPRRHACDSPATSSPLGERSLSSLLCSPFHQQTQQRSDSV